MNTSNKALNIIIEMNNSLKQLEEISKKYDIEDLKNKYKLLAEQLGLTLNNQIKKEDEDMENINMTHKELIDFLKINLRIKQSKCNHYHDLAYDGTYVSTCIYLGDECIASTNMEID
jgi:hypothetical protein